MKNSRRLGIALMGERGKLAARSAVQRVKKAVASKLPSALVEDCRRKAMCRRSQRESEPAQNPKEFGPPRVLSRDPPIFVTGMAFKSMLGIAPAFGRSYRHRPAAFMVYPCWTIDDPNRSAEVIEAAMAHQADHAEHELVFLCNTAAEKERLARGGLNARLLNKNFMVANAIFRPLHDAPVEFDAVYNAQFDPRKRHELASAIEKVGYLAYRCASAGEYDAQRKLWRAFSSVILLTLCSIPPRKGFPSG